MLQVANQTVTFVEPSFCFYFMRVPPILFEDDALIAFDKPADDTFAADSAERGRENLISAIRARFGEGTAAVHRLDPEVSGVFLCAKTKPALDFLSGQFQAKTAEKKYLACVALLPPERAIKDLAPLRDATGGIPDTFTIDLPLRVDEHVKGRMRVGKGRGAMESFSEFRVLERFGKFAWLECRPVTTRTHQLRVHLAALGSPILNDANY